MAPTPPLFTCVLRAQSTNASLTGRVTDLSQATVAESKVAAMNTGTNFHYEAAPSPAGVPFAFRQRHPCSKVSMSVSDRTSKRRVKWNQKMFRQMCGPRTTPSWLGASLMHFKPIRESKN
jgi:hypothetical protein